MDLTTAAVNFQHARILGKVQIAVARKLLDTQQLQGAAMVRLIEAAGRSAKQSGDALVAAATGLGGSVDTFA